MNTSSIYHVLSLGAMKPRSQLTMTSNIWNRHALQVTICNIGAMQQYRFGLVQIMKYAEFGLLQYKWFPWFLRCPWFSLVPIVPLWPDFSFATQIHAFHTASNKAGWGGLETRQWKYRCTWNCLATLCRVCISNGQASWPYLLSDQLRTLHLFRQFQLKG